MDDLGSPVTPDVCLSSHRGTGASKIQVMVEEYVILLPSHSSVQILRTGLSSDTEGTDTCSSLGSEWHGGWKAWICFQSNAGKALPLRMDLQARNPHRVLLPVMRPDDSEHAHSAQSEDPLSRHSVHEKVQN